MTEPLVLNGKTVPAFKLGTTQKVAYTGTAGTIASGVGATTELVRVWCSSDAHVAVGANPTATTSDMPVTGGLGEIFALAPGDKISAIQQSEGGTLYVTELV